MNRHIDRRRFCVMLTGIVVMAAGIALFKLSLMGNDPSTAAMIAIGGRLGVDFSIVLLGANCIWFLAEWRLGPTLIGAGTFVNWFLVGPLASLCEKGILSLWTPPALPGPQLGLMLAGVVTLSLACALYQTADLGIAPYDALSIMLSRASGRSYFLCRILTDSLCALTAFLLGGLLGVGTLVCAVGLGPFIAFFSKTVAQPLLNAPSSTPGDTG